jgi:hypothetical protein
MMDHNSLVASINKGLRQSHSHIDSQSHERAISVANKEGKDGDAFDRHSIENREEEHEEEEEDMMKESACFGGGIEAVAVESAIQPREDKAENEE